MSESMNQPLPDDIKQALMHGDLSGLTAEQQLLLYHKTCESLGLNPLTNPLHYLELKGEGDKKRLVLYATKGCADQLRRIHGITEQVTGRTIEDGLCIVTARSSDATGRYDEDFGIVPIGKAVGTWKTAASGKKYFESDGIFTELHGDERANAIKKAITQAKRRSTLSFCGLGMLDESEIEGIAGAVTREPADVVRHPVSPVQRSALPESSAVGMPFTIPSMDEEKVLADTKSPQEPSQQQIRTAALESSGPKLTAKEVDELLSFLGVAYESDERAWVKVREVMKIPSGQDFTRARVRLQLTRGQHDQLKVEAEQALKDELNGTDPEDDVGDFSGPEASISPQERAQTSDESPRGSEQSSANQEAASAREHPPAAEASDATMSGPATTPAPESAGTAGGTGHEGTYASQAQKDELKELASQISPDEAETVQKSIDRHRHGLPLEIYEMARTRLKNRLAQEGHEE